MKNKIRTVHSLHEIRHGLEVIKIQLEGAPQPHNIENAIKTANSTLNLLEQFGRDAEDRAEEQRRVIEWLALKAVKNSDK